METLESVERDGRERLNPSVTNPSWLVLRKRREIFKNWIARMDRGPLDVLDVGGRIQPYRPLLEGRCRRYLSVDLRPTPLVNVVARGEQLPRVPPTIATLGVTMILLRYSVILPHEWIGVLVALAFAYLSFGAAIPLVGLNADDRLIARAIWGRIRSSSAMSRMETRHEGN